MATKLKAIIELTENNYGAYLVDYDGYIGIGKTADEAKKSLEETIAITNEEMVEVGMDVPNVFKDDYEIEYKIDTATFLQVYGKILTKAGLEKLTGINQKQLWHYASGMRKPRQETRKIIEESIHSLGKELCNLQFV